VVLDGVLAAQGDACLFADGAQGIAQGFHFEPDGNARLQARVVSERLLGEGVQPC
jgi:hypothetical protein